MPEMDELMSRLANLEQGYYGDKQAALENDFMSKYGSRFSNNRGLGLAILNELNARGVDTSAADEAVTSILDQLRTECNELLDMLGDVQQAAVEQAEKLDKVTEVVQDNVLNDPDATVGAEAQPPEGDMIPMEDPSLEGMAEDGEFMSPPEGYGEEPAPEEPAPEMPAEQGVAPEIPAPEEPAPEMPAEQAPGTVSDRRLKRISLKRKSGYKPSAGILAACGGN